MKKSLAITFVLGLLVTACGGDTADTTTTTVSGESTTTVAETTTTGADTTTTIGETTTTLGSTGGGGEDCVVGEWVLDDQAFFDAVFAEFAEEEEFEEFSINEDGEFRVTLNSNGSVSAARNDWGFSISTTEGTFNIVVNGEQTGTWEVNGSMLALNLDGGSGFDVKTTVEVDGQLIDLPTSPVDVPTESLSSSSDFECDGNTLSVTAEGITSNFNRG